jgi:hypothetical protein
MRKILFFISEDWFFVSHFLPMARAARAAGFEVAVATRVGRCGERIASEQCRVIPLDLERGSLAAAGILRGLKHMVENGDWISRTILGVLVIMSAGTWYIFFTKWIEQQRILGQANQVEKKFWTSATLNEGVDKLPKNSMFRSVADAGIRVLLAVVGISTKQFEQLVLHP